jgi:hypothetical protein
VEHEAALAPVLVELATHPPANDTAPDHS